MTKYKNILAVRPLLFVGTIILFGLLAGGYFTQQKLNQEKKIRLTDTQFSGDSRSKYHSAEKVAQKVSELIFIPAGQKPYVTTLQNLDNLKKEKPEFYQHAEEGDHLLLYSTQAVIFSPQKERVISILPIKIINPALQQNLQKAQEGGPISLPSSSSAQE